MRREAVLTLGIDCIAMRVRSQYSRHCIDMQGGRSRERYINLSDLIIMLTNHRFIFSSDCLCQLNHVIITVQSNLSTKDDWQEN